MWRMDTLFRGTELLLAEVGDFQRRSYGPSSFVSMAPLRQRPDVTSLLPAPGHIQPKWLGTLVRDCRSLGSETGGHSRPKRLGTFARRTHVNPPDNLGEPGALTTITGNHFAVHSR